MSGTKGKVSLALQEVGFPGIPDDQVVETSPTTNDLGKDKAKDDEVFDRTDLIYEAKLRVFNCSDSQDADEWGKLASKFLNIKLPKQITDPMAFIKLKEETSFTKDGLYLVAVQWAECKAVGVIDPILTGDEPDEKPK